MESTLAMDGQDRSTMFYMQIKDIIGAMVVICRLSLREHMSASDRGERPYHIRARTNTRVDNDTYIDGGKGEAMS
jgi:hypothetical protein